VANLAFPWRPLGTLLIERGLIDEAQLEKALADQRREGRKLGEILVERGWVTPFGLAAALAGQHGVTLGAEGDASEGGGAGVSVVDAGGEGWRPLGRMLVERGLISDVQLKQALAEQYRSGSRLGEILVGRGWVSAGAVANVVAAQHGLALDTETTLRARLSHEPPERETFVVREATAEGWHDLHVSPSFLDATDMAFDALEERQPEALAIVRVEAGKQEVVWTYPAEETPRAGSETLFDRYGYLVMDWNAAPWLASARSEADDGDAEPPRTA
jgi:hypothetical protein